jgi:hypothetical protein
VPKLLGGNAVAQETHVLSSESLHMKAGIKLKLIIK